MTCKVQVEFLPPLVGFLTIQSLKPRSYEGHGDY